MKREDVKAIEGITDAQVDAVMALAGRDAAAAAADKATAQTTIAGLQQQLQTAQDGLKAFDGVNVNELQGKITTLTNQLTAQAAEFELNAKIHKAIRDAGALDEDDVFALLPDKDKLAASANQDADITAAVNAYKAAKPAYFAAEEDHNDDGAGAGNRGVVSPKPNTGGGNAVTLKDFWAMDYTARAELKEKNPTLFADLLKRMTGR